MSRSASTERPYSNSNLFTGYYLDERLQDREEWDCDDDARSVMDELQELYEDEQGLVEGYNEDLLVQNWIDRVLEILGFGTQVEVTLPDGRGQTDDLLFADEHTRREATEIYLDTEDTRDLYERAISVVEAKQWDADFVARFSEERPYRNASHQIKHYLERTPENLQWGILTNGRKWRLYGTNDYETETYYEVDLPELLVSGDLQRFKYFYLFFRPAAFQESAGTTFLDTVWTESETAARELGEDLQDNVFTALRVLGRGFVDTNDLDVDADDEKHLEELKNQSLVLLYRLMFVLYAEARGLLHPDDSGSQEEYDENFSLDRLRIGIHDTIGEVDAGFEDEYSEHSTQMWNRLETLFGLIRSGEESLGIPPYDGGLFDEDDHEFLTENEVSDQYLAEVIYRLSTTKNGDGRYVLADYADLDTRHLGSVYEGLLEHEFRVAPEQYAAVSENDGQVWRSAEDVTVADAVETVEEGGLYVVNDEGQRKATGAYYTPDYVVTYIVEETVGPLVDEIEEQLEAEGLDSGTEEFVFELSDRVLDLRVLDPAMGSGHFLTKATGYLAERVVERVRDVESDLGAVYDEQAFRRSVAKECIYGVDLNGMAVELAKLSMWLETLAADQPLAFLDHHSKEGNSLVGSDLEEIEDLESNGNGDEGQSSLAQFGATREGTIERLMDVYGEFLAIENETLEDARAMKSKYAEMEEDELRNRLVAMANVHTAEAFNVDVPSGAYERMARSLEDDEEWAEVEAADWFETAQSLAEEHDFLHWKLQFPEVFYNEDGELEADAGFDAVVGNPPYVSSRNEEFYDRARNYVDRRFDLAVYQVDTYYLFVEVADRLARTNGYWSFIVPDVWLGSVNGEAFRSWLVDESVPKLLGLPTESVFDVDVDCLVVVAGRGDGARPTEIWNVSPTVSEFDHAVELNQDGDPFVVSNVGSLLAKIEQDSVALAEITTTGRGIGPYHHSVHSEDTIENRAFHSDHREDESYRPELAGKDVKRFRIDWNGDRWIRYGEWLAEPRTPELFEGPRLLCRKILSEQLCCTYVDSDWLVDQQVYVASQFEEGYDPRYATALLASRLMGFFARTKYHEDTELFPHLRVTQFRELPVETLDFEVEPAMDASDFHEMYGEYLDGKRDIADLIEKYRRDIGKKTTVVQEILAVLVEEIISLNDKRFGLNLDLLDYITQAPEGSTLAEIGLYQPPRADDTDSELYQTASDDGLTKLKIGTVCVERPDENTAVVEATARYKPADESGHDTGPHGYTETEPIEAFRLADLSELQTDLVEAFVPAAADEAGGFADFRENATKTISLVDRLKALTLPDPDAVEDDLRNYLDAKARAGELDEKIERTDRLIDEIVYELYGLTDEEVEIVEEAVGDD